MKPTICMQIFIWSSCAFDLNINQNYSPTYSCLSFFLSSHKSNLARIYASVHTLINTHAVINISPFASLSKHTKTGEKKLSYPSLCP